MSITERARGYVYWLLDYLKGRDLAAYKALIEALNLRK